MLVSLVLVYLSPIKDHLLDRVARFYKFADLGSTSIELIDWDSRLLSIILSILKKWASVFYASFSEMTQHLSWSNGYNAVLIVFVLILLAYQRMRYHRLYVYLIGFFLIYSFLIAMTIHNYGALLRYRSPVLVLFVFALICNIHIRKNYM